VGRRNKLTKSPKLENKWKRKRFHRRWTGGYLSIYHGFKPWPHYHMYSCTWGGGPDSSSSWLLLTSHKLQTGDKWVFLVYCRFTIMGWPRSDVQPWKCKMYTHQFEPRIWHPFEIRPNPKEMEVHPCTTKDLFPLGCWDHRLHRVKYIC
jgi:hypothetical protein